MSPGPVYLVRHAHAGDRSAWQGDDDRRPLSDKGWRQAAGLVARLAPLAAPVRILSSPSLRCVQTVEPLARGHGLPVETDERLLEGAGAEEALELLEEEAARGALAACTHGDVVPGVLDLLRSRGARVDAPLTWPKASTWVLDGDDSGRLVAARYLPPPPA